MGIQITNSVVQPQVTYNKVFLQHLSIDQYLVTMDAPTPKYRVFLEYKLYGVSNGVRYYQPDTKELEVPDFIDEAMRTAALGDTTMLQALPAIEAAVAALIAINLDTDAEVV